MHPDAEPSVGSVQVAVVSVSLVTVNNAELLIFMYKIHVYATYVCTLQGDNSSLIQSNAQILYATV